MVTPKSTSAHSRRGRDFGRPSSARWTGGSAGAPEGARPHGGRPDADVYLPCAVRRLEPSRCVRLVSRLCGTERGHGSGMETTPNPERDDVERSSEDVGDEGREMPTEQEPSPGETDRTKLGEDDVSEQAP